MEGGFVVCPGDCPCRVGLLSVLETVQVGWVCCLSWRLSM